MDDVRVGFSFVNVGGATSQVSFLQGASATITVGQTNGSLTSTVPIFHYSGHRNPLQSLFFFFFAAKPRLLRQEEEALLGFRPSLEQFLLAAHTKFDQ